jgi:hypothetical protein
VRELTQEQRDYLIGIADGYVERARRFRELMKPQSD